MPPLPPLDDETLLSLGLHAAESLHFDEDSKEYEMASFNMLMNTCMTLPLTTVKHIPRSCRPLLAQILSQEFARANRDSLWGFA